MDFKAECTAGDQIECFGMPLTDCANGNGSVQQFLHLLRKGGSDMEVWRARTTWTPRTGASKSAVAAAVASAAVAGTNPASSISIGKVVPASSIGRPSNGSNKANMHLNGSSSSSSGSNSGSASTQTSPTDCSRTDVSSRSRADSATISAAPVHAAIPVVPPEAGSEAAASQQDIMDVQAQQPPKKWGWFGLW